MRELYRDSKAMRDILRQRLLRATVSAAGLLERVARGRAKLTDIQFKAATALMRFVPLIAGPFVEEQKGTDFMTAEWWTPEKTICWEVLQFTDPTAEDFADLWRTCFEKNGPTENYSSREEAAEYGRERFADPSVPRTTTQNIEAFQQQLANERLHRAAQLEEMGVDDD